ncbi:hypothetical protein [Rossellomorea marisflavi]|uniref:hypothetical protein n=1 Tax=Rossellomorea marisflavi TaxID=189381 RepID=UPI00345D99C0
MEEQFNKPMTVGRLKGLLRNIPDDVIINIKNESGDYSSNIEFWYEDLDTRQYINMTSYKPMRKMNKEELLKCGI